MSSTKKPRRRSLAIRSLGAAAVVVAAVVAAAVLGAVVAGVAAVAVVAVAAAAAGLGDVAASAKSSHRLLNPTVKTQPPFSGWVRFASCVHPNWENEV